MLRSIARLYPSRPPRFHLLAAAFCILALALLPPATSAHAATDAATAERLLQLSGIDQQLDGVGRQLRSGLIDGLLSGAGRSATPSERARLQRVVATVVTGDRLRTATRDAVALGFEPRHWPALQRWFDSSLGRRIVKAEIAAGSGDPKDGSLERGATVLQKAGRERRALLTALVDATRADQFLAQLTIDIAAGVERGVASATPGRGSLDAPPRAAQLERQRARIAAGLRSLVLANFAALYAPFGNAELRRYLALLKSPAGRHFNDVTMAAISAALVTTTTALGYELPGIRDQANT
ncbi:MAG: hypothetical protein AB7G13_00875 [Lautropia sp.]